MDIAEIILLIVILAPSVILHEVAHGGMALMLGDKTAKNLGRLSLNPLKHIDPFGSVILPLILAFLNLPVFGYAKPVPVDPKYFKDHRKGMMYTAAAGPATNFLIAIISAFFYHAVSDNIFQVIFQFTATINIILGVFNLLPIPPFDGSKVLQGILPTKALSTYYKVEYYADRYMIVVILLLMFVPGSIVSLLGFILNPIFSVLGLPVNV